MLICFHLNGEVYVLNLQIPKFNKQYNCSGPVQLQWTPSI